MIGVQGQLGLFPQRQRTVCRAGADSMLNAGKWTKVPNSTLASDAFWQRYPPCCGWDGGNGNFLERPEFCGSLPMPIDARQYPAHPVEYQCPPLPFRCTTPIGQSYRGRTKSPFYAHVGGGSCNCPHLKEEYEWEPKTCSVNPWDAKRFCDEVLEGTKASSMLSYLCAYIFEGRSVLLFIFRKMAGLEVCHVCLSF